MKNKKLVLSVLSTAVVASMASSAFAAPQAGLYFNNTSKFYKLSDVLNLSDSAYAEFKTALTTTANWDDIVLVKDDGKGAFISEILDTNDPGFDEALVAEDFLTSYNVVGLDGNTAGTYDARKDVTPVVDQKVQSVSATNATTVVVTFDKELASAAATDFTFDNGLTVSAASLSTDKKSVTLTTSAQDSTKTYKLSYKGTDTGKTFVGFASELKVENVASVDAKHITVTFNKKVEIGGGLNAGDLAGNYTLPNGGGLTVSSVTIGEDGKTATLNLSGAMTNDTAYTVNIDKDIKDENGKLLSDTADVRKSVFFADHTKPTVSDVTVSETGNVTVKFSERLSTKPTLYINNQLINSLNVSFVADSNSVTVAKANLPTSVVAGGTYPITAHGAVDLTTTNTMDLYTGSFTYSVNAEAPSVKTVAAKDEKTLTLEFTEGLSTLTSTELKVYKVGETTPLTLAGIRDVSNGGLSKFEIDLPTGANVLYPSGVNSVNLKVEVKGYKDAAGNFGTNFEQNVTVNKDTQGPRFVKAEYDSTNSEIELTFDETLATGTPLANKFVVTDANGVAYTAVPKANAGKTIVLDTNDPDGAGPLTAWPNGTYSVQVLAGAAKDTALNGGNNNVAASTSVTVGASDPNKPTVTLAQASKGVIQATFNEAVKGGAVAGSATDIANYQINAGAFPTGTTVTLNAGRTVATITLPADAIAVSQAYSLTVNNVQDLAGNAVNSTTQVVTLTENTAPQLLSAQINTDADLVLTFSEDVDGKLDSAWTDPNIADFLIKVNGNTVTGTVYAGADDKQIKIRPTGASFATGTVEVTTVTSTVYTQDAAGNMLKGDTKVNATR